jgi:scyllo-inositol 2-dehydrogenase (NADP+)
VSIRYIVVGLGNIGTKRKAILADRCVATVDPFNAKADFSRIDDVRLENYDAAVLAVPNQVKTALLRELLAKGKHVLVEKPLLFPTPDVALELKELSGNTGAVWYTSYNHRFEPLVRRLREFLEQGVIGSLYHARMTYGNGTAQNSIGSWRESGYGVLEDLGCHLIDLTNFLFDYADSSYLVWQADKIESQVIDHCIIATSNRKVMLECATTMWKNTFTIDVYGKLGSLHLNGLCKWGPSVLLIHQRVFPSGKPIQTQEVVAEEDRTWHMDFDEFEKRVESQTISYVTDLNISMILSDLGQKASTLR